MRSPPRLVSIAALLAALLAALSRPVSAQIISTWLPEPKPGEKRDRFSAHIMETPFARWDYKEVYLAAESEGNARGIIRGQPTSEFMIAGEVAFALGGGHWSLTIGGWHNAIGRYDFNLDASFSLAGTDFEGPLIAKVPLRLTIYETHLGFFYKSAGIQLGVVRTHQGLGLSLIDAEWTVDVGLGLPVVVSLDELGLLPGEGPERAPDFAFHTTTTDLTAFAVFRKSKERWGLSAGAGAYLKDGIPAGSPLRFAGDEIVPSAFVTANVGVYKGLGIDVSYWYVGRTRTVRQFAEANALRTRSDVQSRVTVGVGLSF